ncbi:PH domain-containing protein [Clostridium aminobutyricum]|uniref:PH domain-containing protein n=1 Tax=Clostridium aminobutyricum TaxID=33953 RepID=A0A939DA33_CLOAM|nr:PH domain-containing protein [Clostridium aminobutyricum]MBN7774184.1 PH domain-containing protein [Clostridium aminobutyricum]
MPEVRCHFFSVIMKTFKSIWYIIAAFFFSALNMIKDLKLQNLPSASALIGLGIFFAVILIFFIFHLLRWWRTKIYIEEDTLVIARNQLSQSKTTVKLSSISTVNLQQNLFERIFDVYSLQLDINSSVTADKTDFNLIFDDQLAFAFKDYILAYINEPSQERTASLEHKSEVIKSDPAAEEDIISFRFKDVILHCILSFSIAGFISTIALICAVIWSFNNDNPEISRMIIPTLLSIGVATIPLIYKSITAFFLYYDFTLKKSGDKVLVSYGLFTRRQFTLPLDKTNALVIKQPLQARFFNLAYGEIINIGLGDAANHQAPLFCLLVKPEVLQHVIHQIAPEFVLDKIPEHSPKTALIPTFIPWAFFGILAVIGFTVFFKGWIGWLILVFFSLCAYFSSITKALTLYEDKISITTGIFQKRTITVFYGKIQNMSVRYGPISHKLGLYKGNVSILSSVANKINAIGYFPKERFQAIETQIISHDSFAAQYQQHQ